MNMKTTKKVKPGLKGTKRLVEQYGDKLVCVRYRDDFKNQRKIKTIELIIDERPLSENQSRIPANKIVQLKVNYGEIRIGKLVRNAGGKWNREQGVWELAYGEVIALGLEKRIVAKEKKND